MTLRSLGCWHDAKDEVGEFFSFFFFVTARGLAALSIHPDTFTGSRRWMAESSGLATTHFLTPVSCHANRWLHGAKLRGGDYVPLPDDSHQSKHGSDTEKTGKQSIAN